MAIEEQSDLFWAQCLSAICFLNSSPSRPGEAKAALTACLQQRSSFAWLYLLRGVAFGQMGGLELNAAARLPSRADALKAEAEAHFEAAEADFRKALDRGLVGDLRYALHMNRGVLRFQRLRLDEAVADFERAAALDPTRYHAFASLASALSKQGRRDEAIGPLDRAIALKPDLAALYRARALIRLDGGDPPSAAAEAALRDLDEAIRREPPNGRDLADDHARRARLLRDLGRFGEALAAADAAVAIAPELADAHRERVAALLELRRYGEVIDSCDAALRRGRRRPNSTSCAGWRGWAQRLRGGDHRLHAGPGLAPRLGPGACQPRLGVPVRQRPRAGVPGLRRGGPARPVGPRRLRRPGRGAGPPAPAPRRGV